MLNENTAAPAGAAAKPIQYPWIELENSVARACALLDLMSDELSKLYNEERWATDTQEAHARSKGFGVWHLREYVSTTLWEAFNAAHAERAAEKPTKGNQP